MENNKILKLWGEGLKHRFYTHTQSFHIKLYKCEILLAMNMWTIFKILVKHGDDNRKLEKSACVFFYVF